MCKQWPDRLRYMLEYTVWENEMSFLIDSIKTMLSYRCVVMLLTVGRHLLSGYQVWGSKYRPGEHMRHKKQDDVVGKDFQ